MFKINKYELKGIQKEIWEKKYKAELDTSIEDTWERVANAISSVEEDKSFWKTQFYSILFDFYNIPGGRITNGAGTKNGYLLNCSAIGIEDSLEKIYDTLKKSAIMFKANYGVGFSFHKIRPRNAKLSSGGTSSGIKSFMKVFDSSCGVIKTGGENRRGAQIGVVPVWHPDILDVIEAKNKEGELTNFNLSIGITYDFITAVNADLDWDLVFNGEVYETVKARDLWDKIVYNSYNYNDPGLLMLDEINKLNNLYYCEEIWASNPCGAVTSLFN